MSSPELNSSPEMKDFALTNLAFAEYNLGLAQRNGSQDSSLTPEQLYDTARLFAREFTVVDDPLSPSNIIDKAHRVHSLFGDIDKLPTEQIIERESRSVEEVLSDIADTQQPEVVYSQYITKGGDVAKNTKKVTPPVDKTKVADLYEELASAIVTEDVSERDNSETIKLLSELRTLHLTDEELFRIVLHNVDTKHARNPVVSTPAPVQVPTTTPATPKPTPATTTEPAVNDLLATNRHSEDSNRAKSVIVQAPEPLTPPEVVPAQAVVKPITEQVEVQQLEDSTIAVFDTDNVFGNSESEPAQPEIVPPTIEQPVTVLTPEQEAIEYNAQNAANKYVTALETQDESEVYSNMIKFVLGYARYSIQNRSEGDTKFSETEACLTMLRTVEIFLEKPGIIDGYSDEEKSRRISVEISRIEQAIKDIQTSSSEPAEPIVMKPLDFEDPITEPISDTVTSSTDTKPYSRRDAIDQEAMRLYEELVEITRAYSVVGPTEFIELLQSRAKQQASAYAERIKEVASRSTGPRQQFSDSRESKVLVGAIGKYYQAFVDKFENEPNHTEEEISDYIELVERQLNEEIRELYAIFEKYIVPAPSPKELKQALKTPKPELDTLQSVDPALALPSHGVSKRYEGPGVKREIASSQGPIKSAAKIEAERKDSLQIERIKAEIETEADILFRKLVEKQTDENTRSAQNALLNAADLYIKSYYDARTRGQILPTFSKTVDGQIIDRAYALFLNSVHNDPSIPGRNEAITTALQELEDVYAWYENPANPNTTKPARLGGFRKAMQNVRRRARS